jgi:hypothetical protein
MRVRCKVATSKDNQLNAQQDLCIVYGMPNLVRSSQLSPSSWANFDINIAKWNSIAVILWHLWTRSSYSFDSYDPQKVSCVESITKWNRGCSMLSTRAPRFLKSAWKIESTMLQCQATQTHERNQKYERYSASQGVPFFLLSWLKHDLWYRISLTLFQSFMVLNSVDAFQTYMPIMLVQDILNPLGSLMSSLEASVGWWRYDLTLSLSVYQYHW